MASLDYWAEAPMQRQQMALFAPTLDAMISPDDPVRLVDEVLAGLDWSAWEAEYHGQRGQPPIHPRILAGAILYGLCRGLRSTRKLQEACCYRLDFLWLVEGRQVDYTTFAKFRTRFGPQLKDTFRQIGRLAMSLGLVRLGEVAFDGTRVKANNSRYNTRTAKTLAEKLAALDAQFDQMLAEWDAVEQQRQLDERDDSPTQLPCPLADLDERRQKPERFLTDSGNISGLVQQAMEERGIEFFAPVESPEQQPGNPVLRSDLTQAVPKSEQARLPRNPQGQLDKSCFVYVAAEDRYYCPQGQVLEFEEHKPDRQQGQVVQHRVYRCSACAGCPLHALCVSTQNKRGRTITRDQFTETRQRTAQRMRTPRAKLIYDQRPRIAETPFGILKAVFGMRQFLLCGLDKVRTEWRWAATAFNTMKLVRNLGRLRAQFAELAAEPAA